MDGDRISDVVIGNDGSSDMIYLGGTNVIAGDFSGNAGLPFGSSAGRTMDLDVADLDGDNVLDIAVAQEGSAGATPVLKEE